MQCYNIVITLQLTISERPKKQQKKEMKERKKQFSLRGPYRVPSEALKGARVPNIKNVRKKEEKKGSLPWWTPGGAQTGPKGPKFVTNIIS
jgi:hypothetical protein